MTFDELVKIIYNKKKLVDIARMIKEIDKEHNGYVTSTELEDILKLTYNSDLKGKDVKNAFKEYASI